MAIPLYYSLRSALTRKLTTALTAAGMALVVFVFASISMLAEGLERTLVETGSFDNVIAYRKGSTSEIQSSVARAQASVVEALPEVAIGPDGRKFAAREIVVLISLTKRGTDKPSNVIIRGVSRASMDLRPQVRLAGGRLPREGTTEIIAGTSIARRFEGAGIGETLKFAMREWKVVGLFDAGATGFNSEIWGDAEVLMQAFRRPVHSIVVFKLKDPASFDAVKAGIESDPRLMLEVKRETRYYADQSEVMAKFLRVLGTSLSIIFSIGAVIGAMITMYSSVANRIGEIGTLRALGFGRGAILTAFLAESLAIGVMGGVAGLSLASTLQFFTVSTLNFQTFSELAFTFTLTPKIAIEALLSAVVMGLSGGLLPAIRASRMKIVDALRAG